MTARLYVRALCLLLPVALTALAGLMTIEKRGFSIPLAFLLISALASAALVGWLFSRDRVTLGALHVAGMWSILGLAPLLSFRSGYLDTQLPFYHFFPTLPTAEELTLSAIAVIGWIVFFWLGYRAKLTGASAWLQRRNVRFGFGAVLFQVICAIVSLFYIYEQVGFGVLTRKGFEIELETPGEQTFFISTIRSVSVVALLVLVLALRERAISGVRKAIALSLAVALFIAVVLINNPIAAPRFFTGTFVLAFAYILFFQHARSGLSFLVTFLLAAFMLFPLLDVGRRIDDVPDALEEVPVLVARMLAEDPFRTFEVIPVAVRYVAEHGSTLGYQLLGPLLFWIPRSLWPEKPLGTGTFLNRAYDGFHENVSCPAPCEALVNFGWVGIPLFALVWGLALRAIDDASRPQRDDGQRALRIGALVYPILLGQIFFLTRGDFLSPWSFTVGMLLAAFPLAVALVIGRLLSLLRPRGQRAHSGQ